MERWKSRGGRCGNGGFGSAGSLNAELGPEGPLLGQTVEGNAAMYVHDGFIALATRGDWSSWSGNAGWGLLLIIILMGCCLDLGEGAEGLPYKPLI